MVHQPRKKADRLTCLMIAIMVFTVLAGTGITFSILIHVPVNRTFYIIGGFYILFTFYYIGRNINKILYE